MGLDFIRRAAKGFTKAWDRGRTNLAIPSLFSRNPQLGRRSVIVEFQDFTPCVGAEYPVCFNGPDLVMLHENHCVGLLKSPPSDLVDAVRDVGGTALGQITRFNPISGTGDVEVE